MKVSYARQDMVNAAGLGGIMLAVLPVLHYWVSCQTYASDSLQNSTIFGAAMLLFWIAKLLIGFFLLRFIMVSFAAKYDGVTPQVAYLVGAFASMASGLILGAFSMAYHSFINPEYIDAVIETIKAAGLDNLSPGLDDALEKTSDSFPVGSFFANFFWCSLYGSVLSLILSRKKSSTPEQEES